MFVPKELWSILYKLFPSWWNHLNWRILSIWFYSSIIILYIDLKKQSVIYSNKTAISLWNGDNKISRVKHFGSETHLLTVISLFKCSFSSISKLLKGLSIRNYSQWNQGNKPNLTAYLLCLVDVSYNRHSAFLCIPNEHLFVLTLVVSVVWCRRF
jgi:hypothetical protein